MTLNPSSQTRRFVWIVLVIFASGLTLLSWQSAQADTQYSSNGWGSGTTYRSSWASSCHWVHPYVADGSPCFKQVTGVTNLYIQNDQASVYLYPEHHWFDCVSLGLPYGGCSYGNYQHYYPPPQQGLAWLSAVTSFYYAGWPAPNNWNWDVRGYSMHCDDTTDPYHYSCWWTSDGF